MAHINTADTLSKQREREPSFRGVLNLKNGLEALDVGKCLGCLRNNIDVPSWRKGDRGPLLSAAMLLLCPLIFSLLCVPFLREGHYIVPFLPSSLAGEGSS